MSNFYYWYRFRKSIPSNNRKKIKKIDVLSDLTVLCLIITPSETVINPKPPPVADRYFLFLYLILYQMLTKRLFIENRGQEQIRDIVRIK